MAPPGGGLGAVLPGAGAPGTIPPGVGAGVPLLPGAAPPGDAPPPGVEPPEGMPAPGAICARTRDGKVGAIRESQMSRYLGFMLFLQGRGICRAASLLGN